MEHLFEHFCDEEEAEEEILEQPEQSVSDESEESKPVVGVDLDWDDV